MIPRILALARGGMRLWRRLARLRLWPRPMRGKRTRFDQVVITEAGTGTPTRINQYDVELVRSGTRDKRLRFACPNDCGEMIVLDLSSTRRPHWQVDLHEDGTVSAFPSVVNQACGAHFLIRGNRII